MECPKCQFENAKDMSFCVKCGAQLALEEYKRISSLTFSRIWDGDIYAKSFYMIGMIYERMGRKGKATEN